MDFMKTVPDKYFQLSLVDPPYGRGFDMTCIELDEEYFKAGLQRVQNHLRQLDMFQTRPELVVNNFPLKH